MERNDVLTTGKPWVITRGASPLLESDILLLVIHVLCLNYYSCAFTNALLLISLEIFFCTCFSLFSKFISSHLSAFWHIFCFFCLLTHPLCKWYELTTQSNCTHCTTNDDDTSFLPGGRAGPAFLPPFFLLLHYYYYFYYYYYLLLHCTTTVKYHNFIYYYFFYFLLFFLPSLLLLFFFLLLQQPSYYSIAIKQNTLIFCFFKSS